MGCLTTRKCIDFSSSSRLVSLSLYTGQHYHNFSLQSALPQQNGASLCHHRLQQSDGASRRSGMFAAL